MASVLDLARLSEAVYEDKQSVQNWLRIGLPHTEAGSGFKSAVYQKSTLDEYTLVIAGTDPTEMDDLKSDFQIFKGEMPAQYRVARTAYALAQQLVVFDGLYLTGHSLGGGLASMLAKEHGDPVVTFNSPGMARSFAALQQAETGLSQVRDDERKVLHISAIFDAVSIGTGAHMGAEGSSRRFNVLSMGDAMVAGAAAGIGGLLSGGLLASAAGMGTLSLQAHSMTRMLNSIEGRPEYHSDLAWV